ncbi:MAG TPA: holo-ACP synthase [Candidatus Desulfobacillus sp.]|nr:holo-ACP synthase [Candidatus Desulfobacillus sp.]
MIHGVGADIVAIARLERLLAAHGERAAARLLASSEMDAYRESTRPAAFLAKRFAAKEALAKALGLGLRDPATLRNIAVTHRDGGRPGFACAAQLEEWMHARRLRAHLSLSDERDSAIAFVVVESEEAA